MLSASDSCGEKSTVSLVNITKFVRPKVGVSFKPSPGEKSEKKRGYTFHKLYTMKKLTPDEDEIILKRLCPCVCVSRPVN